MNWRTRTRLVTGGRTARRILTPSLLPVGLPIDGVAWAAREPDPLAVTQSSRKLRVTGFGRLFNAGGCVRDRRQTPGVYFQLEEAFSPRP